MNVQECEQVYNTLADLVSDHGLQWVTDQVAEQIRIGKTSQREIETLRETRATGLFAETGHPKRLTRGPKETFPVTEDYAPADQVMLLIDAVEQAVVNTADMERHLVEVLQSDGDHLRVEFTDGPEHQTRSLDGQKATLRFASTRKIKELLDSLRKEVLSQ